MARAEKVAAVAELTERFQTSAGAVLTEYRGLSVAQLGNLRQSLGDHATFSVVKNTLTKIAAADAGVAGDLTAMLSGPSAIAFVSGDVVEAAKGLRDFSKANPFLVIKGGVLDGKMLTPEEIVKLADLESREVLLAKLAGAIKATMSNAAATFAALPVQMARLLAALEEKRSAEAPSPEAPSAEASSTEAPSAEASSPEAPSAEAPSGEPAAAAEAAAAEAVPASEGDAASESDAASEIKDG
jgi:large subunit ribosomal protein L10